MGIIALLKYCKLATLYSTHVQYMYMYVWYTHVQYMYVWYTHVQYMYVWYTHVQYMYRYGIHMYSTCMYGIHMYSTCTGMVYTCTVHVCMYGIHMYCTCLNVINSWYTWVFPSLQQSCGLCYKCTFIFKKAMMVLSSSVIKMVQLYMYMYHFKHSIPVYCNVYILFWAVFAARLNLYCMSLTLIGQSLDYFCIALSYQSYHKFFFSMKILLLEEFVSYYVSTGCYSS